MESRNHTNQRGNFRKAKRVGTTKNSNTMADTMNMQLGAQFQLLKTNLVAVYEKEGETNRFLLAPMDIKEVNKVTLTEMIDDLGKAFDTIDVAKIKKDISELKGIKLDQLKFSLKTAYIYIEGTTKEYAFSIEVDCGDAFPDLGFAKVEKLFFSIWNTSRNKVITKMNLDTIENLVKVLK